MARKFGINPAAAPKVESPLLKRFNEKPAVEEQGGSKAQVAAKPEQKIQVQGSTTASRNPAKRSDPPKQPAQTQKIEKPEIRKTDREGAKVVRPTIPGGVPVDQRDAVERMERKSGQELANIVLAVTKRATAAIAANEDINVELCSDVPEMIFGGTGRRISIPQSLLTAVQEKHDPLGLQTTIQTGTAIYAAYVRREISALAGRLGVSI